MKSSCSKLLSFVYLIWTKIYIINLKIGPNFIGVRFARVNILKGGVVIFKCFQFKYGPMIDLLGWPQIIHRGMTLKDVNLLHMPLTLFLLSF